MVEQITSGIKVSVETSFEGTYFDDQKIHYVFAYFVTIYNQSDAIVQLQNRQWTILDSLNYTEDVFGEGVIGKKPVLHPGESHTYSSNCVLKSPLGAMVGFYEMINHNTNLRFKVVVPTFKLCAPFAIN